MKYPQAVQSYLDTLGTELSRRSTEGSLVSAARYLLDRADAGIADYDWTKLDADTVTRALGKMREDGKAPATVRKVRSAITGVARAAWRAGTIEDGVLARVTAVPHVRGGGRRLGRAVKAAEVAKLLLACDASNGGEAARARDRALLAMLFGAGLRRSEAAGALLSGWDAETGSIEVVGKGQKRRKVPMGDAARHIEAWLGVRGTVTSDRLFLGVHHRGAVQDQGLTPEAIYQALSRLGKRAGVKVSPHDGRRTRITSLFAASVDMATVQRLAGHASPATTVKYDRRGQDALEEAVRKVGGGL